MGVSPRPPLLFRGSKKDPVGDIPSPIQYPSAGEAFYAS